MKVGVVREEGLTDLTEQMYDDIWIYGVTKGRTFLRFLSCESGSQGWKMTQPQSVFYTL